MNNQSLLLGECAPLGPAVAPTITSSARLVIPYWPSDPMLGSVRWPAEVELLMPGRWAPPVGEGVRYAGQTYLEQARAVPGTVDALAVAAVRTPEGWRLPRTYGTTGAVGAHGVDHLLVVEADDEVVLPGAPLLVADRVTVLGPAPARVEGPGAPARIDDSVDRVGARVAALVPAGSWVELGIGVLPSAVLRHLQPGAVEGFLCGMVGDEVLELADSWWEAGHHRPVHAAMVDASPARITRAAGRGQLRLLPPEESHGPRAEPPLVAVNAALSVDLTGAVNTERVGGRRVSGRGGHPDFTRRAHLSPGGVSVVVLRARARDGQPCVVPTLGPDERSTAAADVDVIVTEHGIADLRGLDPAERAAAIVEVAHPDDRAALRSAAAAALAAHPAPSG